MAFLTESTAAGPKERAFLQKRVGLFGLLAAGCFGFFLLFRMVAFGEPERLGPRLTDPSFLLHLAATLCFAAIWVVCRGRAHSLRWIRTVESVGLLGATAVTVAMGSTIPLSARPDFILLVVLSVALTTRTLFVPSSARRTFALTGLVGLQITVAVFFFFRELDFARWELLIPEVALMSRDQLAGVMAGTAAAYWVMTLAVTTAASRVIYGLRREIRDAKQLGQYRLEHKIGEGGMGTVYRARHALLRRPTAIKLLRPDRTGEANLRRFEQEVQHTAQLSHPNIITIFDYGHTPDGVFYYAMEYLGGITLAELVEEYGPQPVGRVVQLLEQIAAALVHAHGDGLIHRDIKPANIMLFLPHRHGGQPEQIKLLDFGLVKEVKDKGGVDLTQADAVSGTPQYMSPESISAPDTVDGRSDLYAVGAVAYYLLSGHHVFEGESVIEVCAKHLHTEPEPLASRAPGTIPEELERLIMACLAKDPEDRPASALALLGVLEQLPETVGWKSDAVLQWWVEHDPTAGRDAKSKASKDVLTVDIRRPTA